MHCRFNPFPPSRPGRSRRRPGAIARSLFGFLGLAFVPLTLAAEAENTPDRKKPFTARDLSPEQRAEVTEPPADRPQRLVPGERLVYKIGWSWFDVGEAELVLVDDEHDGEPVWRMELRARTNSFADAFYKVRNVTRSWIRKDVSEVVHYEAVQREGDREREVVVDFDPVANTAQYVNRLNGDTREPIPILDGTWDPMSITYFVRSLPLIVGEEMVIPTTNGKSLYLTRVAVTKRTIRDFRTGRQPAYVLEPDIEDLGGVFDRSDDASIKFFFSADQRQLPLRMESKVAVGRFWAELDRVEKLSPEERSAITDQGLGTETAARP